MMKVLHYRGVFSPLTETFIYDYIIELENRGIDNYVLTHNRLMEKERPFKKVIKIKKPGRRDIERIARRIKGIIYRKHPERHLWPQKRRRIRKALAKIKPDIIHAHFGDQGVTIGKIAQELHIPFIVSFHGYDAFQLSQNEFWKQQYQEMNTLCAGITCVSKYMEDYLSSFFDISKTAIIHVGKNLDEYTYIKPEGNIKCWISIGRLTNKKGHEDAIKAFHRVVKKYPDQQLKIIGEGALKDDLQHLIDELELSDKITLTGAIPHHQVKKELNKADAFILCSKTTTNGDKEGIPTVLMEAQAIGLPCVSTKHSGIPEVFPQENQFLLAEEGNVECLFHKMERLIHLPLHEVQKLAERARKKIEQEFNVKKETQKLIRLYRDSA
jgi:glycosyltransferase involved in cell wall biosynthesis